MGSSYSREATNCRRVGRELLEHFRCPEGLLEFVAKSESPSPARFFRFGAISRCYGQIWGQLSSSQQASGYDALDDTVARDGYLALPFDPDEVINNFRFERYAPEVSGHEILKTVYYLVRPLTTRSTRQLLQRYHSRKWKEYPFPRWPVDVSVETIRESLLTHALRAKGISSIPFIWYWPEGKSSCAIMTHDVESHSGLDSCNELMDIDDSYAIKASFQIVPEARYRISAAARDDMKKRGFEVNVHDLRHNGRLFSDRAGFLRQAQKINQYCEQFGSKGFRSGALYRKLDWYDAFRFEYDMSAPNVAHLDPQRGGCCTVMPFFVGDIVELPVTTTQDYSLFNILGSYSIELWEQQIDIIRKHHGLISFIVHPDYLDTAKARETYESLLRHLSRLSSESDIWTATPGQVNDWWRQRSRMKLVQHNGEWRIEGPGAERARIGYAKFDGDTMRLLYFGSQAKSSSRSHV